MSRHPCYLGIDVGTSAVKTVLADERQRVLVETSAAYQVSRPCPLAAEQDPALWVRAMEETLAAVRRAAPDAYARVAAIGLSGQMHGLLALDRDNRPLRPAMLWNDGRAHAQAAALACDHPELAEEVGVPPMPGFTGPKALWLAENEPEVFARLDCLLPAKDYLRLMLTGERATDPSDASGTWLYDQARQDWSAKALAAVGLAASRMPRIVEGNAVSGSLLPDAAARLGLPADVIVAGGAGDCAAGAIGAGVIDEGSALLSLGTGALLLVPTRVHRPAPDRLIHSFRHALPGRWFQMAAMLNGGSVLAWAAALAGKSPAEQAEAVEARYHGPGGTIFLPYLTGERTPHNDPFARGVLFGLTPETDAVALALAAMEGVAFSFADARDALEASGTRLPAVGILGGGGKSRLWTRIIAAVMDRPMIRYRGGETGPAFGAARLARLARTGEAPEAVCSPPEIRETIEPEADLRRAYAPSLARFRALYPLLRETFTPGGTAAPPPEDEE